MTRKQERQRRADIRQFARSNPNVPYTEIAKRFGISHGTVTAACKGQYRINWKAPKAEIREFAALHTEFSYREIAIYFAVPKITVARACQGQYRNNRKTKKYKPCSLAA